MLKNEKKLKEITNYLGKTTLKNNESNDIVCIINPKKLDKFLYDNKYTFKTPIGQRNNITYVIEDYDFIHNFKVDTNASIIFKNCNFFKELYVENANKIQLEDNKYMQFENDNFIYGKSFITTKNVNELCIKDDNIQNKVFSVELDFNMDLKADKIKISNSNLSRNEEGFINIETKDLIINSSNISCDKLFIDAHYARINPTTNIYADKVAIFVDRYQIECPIYTTLVIDNGVKEDSKGRKMVYKKNNF